jgi:putative hydrolase of the HAD superfamily
MGETLGIPHLHEELMRLYHEQDVLGRCLGKANDPFEVIRCLAHRLDPSIPDQRIATALANRRRRIEHALVNIEPPILAAIDRLRECGVRLALVSDAAVDDVEFWHRSPLASRLDAVVFSYEIGIRKPDRRIYEHALSDIAARPEDALFVGDGASDEHRGARAVGLGAVLVTRFVSHWRPEVIAERRPHADWEFEDVPAFVDALQL